MQLTPVWDSRFSDVLPRLLLNLGLSLTGLLNRIRMGAIVALHISADVSRSRGRWRMNAVLPSHLSPNYPEKRALARLSLTTTTIQWCKSYSLYKCSFWKMVNEGVETASDTPFIHAPWWRTFIGVGASSWRTTPLSNHTCETLYRLFGPFTRSSLVCMFANVETNEEHLGRADLIRKLIRSEASFVSKKRKTERIGTKAA